MHEDTTDRGVTAESQIPGLVVRAAAGLHEDVGTLVLEDPFTGKGSVYDDEQLTVATLCGSRVPDLRDRDEVDQNVAI